MSDKTVLVAIFTQPEEWEAISQKAVWAVELKLRESQALIQILHHALGTPLERGGDDAN